jgi:hypothetical protein
MRFMEKLMGMRSSGPLPAEAGRLKAAIQSWRETRAKVGPMPADLWQRAASLAAGHGVCRIARAIEVDYSALRERMEVRDVRTPEPAFLEIPGAMLLAGSPGQEAGPETEAQVDIALADGSQLRMRGRSLDAAAIVAAFMRRS